MAEPATGHRRGWFAARAAALPAGPAAATLVICRELARFCLPVLLPAAVVLVASVGLGWVLPAVLAGTVLLLWASFVVHETGHALALRLLPAGAGRVPAVFLVDRSGPAVHRPGLSGRGREAVVILAGPVLPVLLWALGVAAAVAAGAAAAPALVWTGIVAWGHPVALLAPAGDGRALWRLWRAGPRS